MAPYEMIPFQMANPADGGYTDAHYRRSPGAVVLQGDSSWFNEGRIEVPSRLEVLTRDGKWQQQPVVFEANGQLYIIRSDGRYHSAFNGGLCNPTRDLLAQAERLGLTQGSLAGIRMFPRETD